MDEYELLFGDAHKLSLLENQLLYFLKARADYELFGMSIFLGIENTYSLSAGLKGPNRSGVITGLNKHFSGLEGQELANANLFREIVHEISKTLPFESILDSNAYRASKVIIGYLEDNYGVSFPELLPKENYEKKELFYQVLYLTMKKVRRLSLPKIKIDLDLVPSEKEGCRERGRSHRREKRRRPSENSREAGFHDVIIEEIKFILSDLSFWLKRTWLPILKKEEIRLQDNSQDSHKILLDELNVQIQKEDSVAKVAEDFHDVLIYLDDTFGYNSEFRIGFINRAKSSISRKKHRKKAGVKQKNFLFSTEIVDQLRSLSQHYEMSETMILSVLIKAESKDSVHLEALNKRLEKINQYLDE